MAMSDKSPTSIDSSGFSGDEDDNASFRWTPGALIRDKTSITGGGVDVAVAWWWVSEASLGNKEEANDNQNQDGDQEGEQAKAAPVVIQEAPVVIKDFLSKTIINLSVPHDALIRVNEQDTRVRDFPRHFFFSTIKN